MQGELRYDGLFQRITAEVCPELDWRLVKAVAIVESSLNPRAVSPCGAMGLMQIMPATWGDLSRTIPIKNPYDPEDSIRAGAALLCRLRRYWRERGVGGATSFAIASYNAGLGNVRKAWRISGCNCWLDVALFLPRVTGRHAQETIQYVDRVRGEYENLKA